MVISPVQAVYFVLFITALRQLDREYPGAKILGNSTGLSGFWVMLRSLCSAACSALWGMAVGVPLFAVLYTMATGRSITC